MKRKIDIVALIILIAAAMNCGLIGVFRFDVMTWLFDGQSVAASRIIYALVAAAGLWCLNLIAVQAHRSHTKRTAAPDPVYNRNTVPDPVLQSDPRSLKDNPAAETVCSPHFSQGCINEDTDSSAKSEEEDKNEKH